MRRKRNTTVLTSLETKVSLNQVVEATLILEEKQKQDVDALFTLAEVCAEQCQMSSTHPRSSHNIGYCL